MELIVAVGEGVGAAVASASDVVEVVYFVVAALVDAGCDAAVVAVVAEHGASALAAVLEQSDAASAVDSSFVVAEHQLEASVGSSQGFEFVVDVSVAPVEPIAWASQHEDAYPDVGLDILSEIGPYGIGVEVGS